jgi:peptidoglycan/LPS O-acetylase OafA/YrhL
MERRGPITSATTRGLMGRRMAMMTKAKLRVLASELLLVASLFAAIAASGNSAGWSLLLQLQFPVVLGALFLLLAQIKCPSCGVRLSQSFPVGALSMLPFSTQHCTKCQKSL